MLLVDDHVSKSLELHVGFDEGVSADEDVNLAIGEALLYLLLLTGAERAYQQFYSYVLVSKIFLEIGKMLSGQYFGWSHEACLAVVVEGYEDGEQCHEGLSTAHIALQQTIHLPTAAHIGAYFFDDSFLRSSEREG